MDFVVSVVVVGGVWGWVWDGGLVFSVVGVYYVVGWVVRGGCEE